MLGLQLKFQTPLLWTGHQSQCIYYFFYTGGDSTWKWHQLLHKSHWWHHSWHGAWPQLISTKGFNNLCAEQKICCERSLAQVTLHPTHSFDMWRGFFLNCSLDVKGILQTADGNCLHRNRWVEDTRAREQKGHIALSVPFGWERERLNQILLQRKFLEM